MFDAAANKQGILEPNLFRKTFEDKVDTAKFLGISNFTRGFVEKVYFNEIEGMTFEGIVAKAGSKHDIIRGKAKTKLWIDKVMATYAEKGQQLVDS